MNVLGVKIDDVSMQEALIKIEKWIWNPGKHYVVTPNPEIIMTAQKDKKLMEILNKADLAIPDGVGLKLSGKVKNTVAGTDLMEKLIALSGEKGFKIAFLGGQEGIAERLAERLTREYQNILITFAGSDGNIGQIPPTDLLFVAFGAPKQEKWIDDNLSKQPVNVMMGVGGAFDYLSGKTLRAPVWLRNLGLEWLFRLVTQPWRIKRQLSLIKYIWLLQQSK